MTEIDIIIDDISYKWYRYDKPLEILNAVDVNNAISNAKVLHSALTAKGYTLNDIQESTANYDTELIQIVDKLNAVEYNLDVINSPIIMSIYYGKPVSKVAGELAHNREEIWRWFQILEDMLEIVQGIKPKWGALLCTDGYPTIGGKRLIARGEYIV